MISNQNKIIIGSRSSPLAQKQVEIFLDSLGKVHGKEIFSKIEKRYFKTAGDKLLHANFMDFGYKGLFTKEIDEALVKKEITFAVHSLKDLPTKLPRNLEIVAVLRREEVNDVIVSKNFQTLEEIAKLTGRKIAEIEEAFKNAGLTEGAFGVPEGTSTPPPVIEAPTFPETVNETNNQGGSSTTNQPIKIFTTLNIGSEKFETVTQDALISLQKQGKKVLL